ncbi:Carboxypeptidase regulatory-like domain protein [Thermoplasmatales archaeon SCGC AB-539-N05]|nr:Carboxypeptidase regulatory-like domain protein [Thermoplasmatales archaeon SCGC AB-539-N05]
MIKMFRKTVAYLIILLLVPSIFTMAYALSDDEPSWWNSGWRYRQEIYAPISTDGSFAIYQPIDIRIEFDYSCWAKNENRSSVRVCCWHDEEWYELESQVYDFNFKDDSHASSCSLVFLVPDIANGHERYFVYYSDHEMPSAEYQDHVSVTDDYYYYEPISGVLLEADYYKVVEDGFCVYGVAQRGVMMDMALSQTIVKLRSGSRDFTLENLDQIAAFCMSYYCGDEEKDENSTVQSLVSTDIFVDGNLMVEFGIVSESTSGDLRTTNVYKYYYSPSEDKRMCVHVKHEVLNESRVKGKEDLDGRYAALISFRYRNELIKSMNFGDILPFLHCYGEDEIVRKYVLNPDPDSKEREWILSVKDDVDLGSEAWVSSDEGEQGLAHAIIFSSNTGVVRTTDFIDEDGIQVTTAEKEYLNFLGLEVDYATINCGRNSYEKDGAHNLVIPKGFVVEFDAEFFTSEENGYVGVAEEAGLYHTLIKYRPSNGQQVFDEEKGIYVLAVVLSQGGTRLSFPLLANITGFPIPVVWVELYRNETLVASGIAKRSIPTGMSIRFSKLIAGEYLIKVYWKTGNNTQSYIGVKKIELEDDMTEDVYCTWQRSICFSVCNQYNIGVKDVDFSLIREDFVVAENATDDSGKTVVEAPFYFLGHYVVRGMYKGFVVYEEELKWQKKIYVDLELYDLTVKVKDLWDLPPCADVKPVLTSSKMVVPVRLSVEEPIKAGRFLFKDLPSSSYKLQIKYKTFVYEKDLVLPIVEEYIDVVFNARFDVAGTVFDARGNPLEDVYLSVGRGGKKIGVTTDDSGSASFLLPPGNYHIEAFSDGERIGVKEFEVAGDGIINLVTDVQPFFPIVVTVVSLFLIIVLILLFVFQHVSFTVFLKLIALFIIMAALVEPWWLLSGDNVSPMVERSTELFVLPPAMVDSVACNGEMTLNMASLPDLFTGFLDAMILFMIFCCICISISVGLQVLYSRRFLPLVFVSIAAVLLFIVLMAFGFGMSKICEISLGGLYGEGLLSTSLFTGEAVLVSSSWGLSTGFCLCVTSVFLLVISGIFDVMLWRKKVSS